MHVHVYVYICVCVYSHIGHVVLMIECIYPQGGVVLKEVPVKEKGIMTHLKALVTKKLIVLKLVVECMNDTVISLDDCDGVVLPVFRIHVYFTDELFGYFSKDAVHEPSVRVGYWCALCCCCL